MDMKMKVDWLEDGDDDGKDEEEQELGSVIGVAADVGQFEMHRFSDKRMDEVIVEQQEWAENK